MKYGSGATESTKFLSRAASATGLNKGDISTAISSPRKIAYLEETVRSMEQGSLKIRVRSLENEKALERLALSQSAQTALILAAICLQVRYWQTFLVSSVCV